MVSTAITVYLYGALIMFVIESIQMGYNKFETKVTDVLLTAVTWPAFVIGLLGIAIRLTQDE